MPRKKAARLGGDMLVQKGQATPTQPVPTSGTKSTVAVTLRLEPELYRKLKVYGAHTRRTNQDILLEALHAYLASQSDGLA